MQDRTSPTDSMIALLTVRTCLDNLALIITQHCYQAGIIIIMNRNSITRRSEVLR